MPYIDDDLDEGDVPPLLDVETVNLNVAASSALKSSSVAAASKVDHDKPPVERAGLRKGFLSGDSSAMSASKGTRRQTSEVPVIRGDTKQKKKSLELPEVQQQIQQEKESAPKANGADGNWVTPALMQKIGANPILRKAFTDPRCQEAMTALQTNPQDAIKRYGDNPEMREFLQAFMKLMGDHFTELADKQDEEQKPLERKMDHGSQSIATRPSDTEPIIAPAKSVEQRKAEHAVEAALRDPEVATILQEPQVQTLLGKLQAGHAHELDVEMRRDPTLIAKLRKLSQAGLIGMRWA